MKITIDLYDAILKESLNNHYVHEEDDQELGDYMTEFIEITNRVINKKLKNLHIFHIEYNLNDGIFTIKIIFYTDKNIEKYFRYSSTKDTQVTWLEKDFENFINNLNLF